MTNAICPPLARESGGELALRVGLVGVVRRDLLTVLLAG